MDSEDKEDVTAGLDLLQAGIAGLTVAIGALIQTHSSMARQSG